MEKPVDPSNIKWKNMQIKKPERVARGFLVTLTIGALLYISFMVQVIFSGWRFENSIYEKIDCAEFNSITSTDEF